MVEFFLHPSLHDHETLDLNTLGFLSMFHWYIELDNLAAAERSLKQYLTNATATPRSVPRFYGLATEHGLSVSVTGMDLGENNIGPIKINKESFSVTMKPKSSE